MDHGEPAHRARAEDQQREARNQRGDVRVQDGAEGAVVARADGRLRRGAATDFLADALVDQHVGVDRHAQGQRNGGDAGQREGGLQERQQGHQEEQVRAQCHRGDQAEQHVVRRHEHDDGHEPPLGGVEALLDVVLAQARADGALLDDFHRRRQRTGAQEQRRVVRFHGVHASRNLDTAATDFGADHRGGHDFALAFFDQQDCHALADAFPRYIAEDARAGAVKRQVHRGLLGLVVEPGLRVGQPVAGEDHGLLHKQRGAVPLDVVLVAERHFAPGRRGQRLGVHPLLVHHADFEAGRAAEDVLGLGRVLHAGQLYNDAVGALLLDHRLGDTQFVDPVVQGCDVLLQRVLLRALGGLLLQRAGEAELLAVLRFRQLQVGDAVLDQALGFLAGLGVAKAHAHVLAFARDARVPDVLLAQLAAGIPGEAVEALGEGRLHVHLEQEVHAAAQVEAEVHRQRVDGGQPVGRGRKQVQRDHVGRVGRIRVQGLRGEVLGLELRVGVREANADAVDIDQRCRVGDVALLEGFLDAREHRGVDLDGGLAAGHLHGRRFAVEVGQRVQECDHHGERDEGVFPGGVSVHCCLLEAVCLVRATAGS